VQAIVSDISRVQTAIKLQLHSLSQIWNDTESWPRIQNGIDYRPRIQNYADCYTVSNPE